MTNILKIQEKIKNFKIMLPSLQNLGLNVMANVTVHLVL